MQNTLAELAKLKGQNKVLQDFLAENKTDTSTDVKASRVQSIKASDPFVTTGNSMNVDTTLESKVRDTTGVTDKQRLKAKEARLPEDVRIKRQFEQIYNKQKAADRKTILKNLAKDTQDTAPEGGVSPYDTMDAELSNIMRSRLNLPEEEEQKPSLLESLKSGISSFFADDRKTSAGETLVDSISGEGKQDPRVQALAALEAANMPTTEANIQAVLAQLQEGG